MGYYLQAFICRKADTSLLTQKFDKAVGLDLAQGISLIPMTEELFDQINDFSSSPLIDKFEYMTEPIEKRVLNAVDGRKFAYVEAEYFGGEGGQMAIIWENNERQRLLSFGDEKINEVLRDFDVLANHGQDEFSTVGLERHRNTRDWVKNIK